MIGEPFQVLDGGGQEELISGAGEARAPVWVKIGGMDRQTLRDWVHRFNAQGPEGLIDRKAPGQRPKLKAAQMARLAAVP